MPGILINSTDRVTISGLPGTGKTTLTRYLCSLVEPYLLLYDPLDQYTGFKDECRHVPKTDSLIEFDNVCKQLCARSNVTFVVEEAERYLGQGKPLYENTFNLINRGRNWGVGIIAVTRRIQRLSKDYFDLCQHVIFFRCGVKSRGYIKDMCGWGIADKVIKLERYHFLMYNVETEETAIRYLNLAGTRPHLEGKGKEVVEGKGNK